MLITICSASPSGERRCVISISRPGRCAVALVGSASIGCAAFLNSSNAQLLCRLEHDLHALEAKIGDEVPVLVLDPEAALRTLERGFGVLAAELGCFLVIRLGGVLILR